MSAPQLALNDLPKAAVRQRPAVEVPDFWNVICRRKLGASAEWLWFEVKALDDGSTLVRGASPERWVNTRKHGPRPVFRASRAQTCVVTDADMESARLEWESVHGHCARCGGCGEVARSFRAGVGVTEYKSCPRCAGSGKPVGVAP